VAVSIEFAVELVQHSCEGCCGKGVKKTFLRKTLDKI